MIPTPTLPHAEAAAWRPELLGEDSEDLLAWYHAVVPGLRPDAHVVEVGVSWGRTLVYLAEIRAAHGHRGWTEGVDSWLGPNAHPFVSSSRMSYHSALASVVAHSSPRELETVCLQRRDSLAAAAAHAPRSLDMVVVDACHDKVSVMEDILAWRSKVKVGGLLCGHDYSRAFPGVMAAVDMLLRPQFVVHGTVWVHEV